MSLIGGLIASDSSTVCAAQAKIAGRTNAAIAWHRDEPVGLFASPASEVIEQGAVCLVADLELTNLPELYSLAGGPMERYGLLAALYAMDGRPFVRRLRGGFAIVLWDRHRQTLLLAVDHLGIKRLYYTNRPDRFACASRPGVLPVHDAGIHVPTVYTYLNFGFVPVPESIFTGVHRLAPGHVLYVQGQAQIVESYWDLEYTERPIRRRAAAAEIRRLAEDGVAHAVRDTEPKEVGVFLSGGTDSSTVLGLASRLTDHRMTAFSIGFREDRYNELGYAEIAARHFGAAHHTKVVGPEEALDALNRIANAYDEPFGNNSAIGTLLCADLASECGITRLLAGDGGDEIFGGNEHYRTDRIFARYHYIPAVVRRGLLEPVLLTLPDGGASALGRAQRYIRRANLPNPRRFYSWEFFFAQRASEFLTPEFRQSAVLDAPWDIIQNHWDRIRADNQLNRQLYLDMKLTIGDNDLLKVTRTAELAGVEVRFPLLDLPLVEAMAAMPSRFKLRGLEKRHLFKYAFRSLLPAEVLAKRKHGFGVPTSVWLKTRGRFRRHVLDILFSPRFLQRGYFRPDAIDRLLASHEADESPYYGDLLWRVLMLELWHRSHIDGQPA